MYARMETQPMTIDELDRRLEVFDGFVPRADIVAGLRSIPELTHRAKFYQQVAVVCGVLFVVALLTMLIVLNLGIRSKIELSVYRERCMTPESAEAIVTTAEAVAKVNATCIEYHEDDRRVMHAVLAHANKLHEVTQTANRNSNVIYAIGSDYAIGSGSGNGSDSTYENVSVLPDAEAGDFVLHDH